MRSTMDFRHLARVQTLPMAHPADMSQLEAAIRDGQIDPSTIVCVLVKTEGNGLDNDYTRVMATDAIRLLLTAHQPSAADAVSLIASGGCEGLTTPHMTVFEVLRASPDAASIDDRPRLAIGRSASARMKPEWIGTLAQAKCVRDAVRKAMHNAGLSIEEVAYVEVKAAMLTNAHQEDARARGVQLKAASMHASKTFSRAASALGIALALEEVQEELLSEEQIGADPSVFTAKGCVTAGDLDLCSEVVVFGNSTRWAGKIAVASTAMYDLLDVRSLSSALRRLDLHADPQLSPQQVARVKAVIFKGEPSHTGLLRGERQVMWRDSDVHALRQMRAAMSGVIASMTGMTRLFIGGGAEHQGPEGGGTAAIFAELV